MQLAKLAQRLNQAAIGVAGIDAVHRPQFDFAPEHPAEFAASIYPPEPIPKCLKPFRTLTIQCTRYSTMLALMTL